MHGILFEGFEKLKWVRHWNYDKLEVQPYSVGEDVLRRDEEGLLDSVQDAYSRDEFI